MYINFGIKSIYSLGAPLCVLYKPNVIAAAALLLATHLDNDRVNESWYEHLSDVDVAQVHGKLIIC